MSKKEAVQKKAAIQKPRTLMYCGPTIMGIAQHGLLFEDMPPLLEKFAGECPVVKSFIVDPKDYMFVKQEAERKGGLLNTRYQMVLEYLQRR